MDERTIDDRTMGSREPIEILIEDENESARVDLALSLQLPEISRSFIQKLIETGEVKINGKICISKKQKVKAGDMVSVNVPEPRSLEVTACDIPLKIVYEDDDLLVVDKPRGMVVHPAAGNESGTLVNALLFHCGDRLSSINGVIRPGIVHRIDKDTSGLLVVAKNDMAHESLSAQLADHSITRRYEALVFANLKEEEGTIDAPIGRDPKNRLRQAVTLQNSKRAVTHWKVLERFGSYTLIEARLETGRTHQIRVHMAYIRHPLVGDIVYGPKKQPFGVSGQLLHAKILGFVHPRSGEYMEFESQRPEIFDDVLSKIRDHKGAGR